MGPQLGQRSHHSRCLVSGSRLEIAAIATEKNHMVGRQVVGRQVVGRQLGRRLLSGFWRGFIAANLAAMVLFLLPASAPAQVQSLVAPQSVTAPAAGPVTGWPGSPGATILAPAPVAPAPVAPMPAAPLGTSPVAQAAPAIPAGQVLLAVAARYGQNAAPITGGLIWRII